VLIGIEFAQQISGLSEALQDHREWFNFATWLDPVAHPRVAQIGEWISARLNVPTAQLGDQLAAGVAAWATALAKSSGQFFLGTAGVLLKFFLMLFILFFILRDGSLGSGA
jgi:predicted PurR-regulated permease PerM